MTHPTVVRPQDLAVYTPLARRRLANRFPGAVQISALTGGGFAG